MRRDRKSDFGNRTAKHRNLRIYVLGLFFLLGSSGIVARLFYLQCSEYGKWQQHAASQHSTKVDIRGARGEILDTLGRTLATSVEVASVGAHPNRAKDKEKLAQHLHRTTGVELKEVRALLSTNKKFVWIKRGLPVEAEPLVRDYAHGEIEVFREFKRYYPQEKVAGSVLGKVGQDGQGLSGIELQFEQQLRAQNSQLEVGRDAKGRFSSNIFAARKAVIPQMDDMFGDARLALGSVGIFSAGLKTKNSEAGADDEALRTEGGRIALTIDSYIQNIIEEEFSAAQTTSGAKQVFGLVMDAENGEVLALAQVPGFDPNEGAAGSGALRNHVLQDSFEPGSTFKPLVAAAALSQDAVGINEILDCENGKFRVGKHTIRDVHGVGVVPFSEVLVRSSNVGMTKVGRRLGAKRLYEALKGMGFGTTTGLELRGEAKGILRHSNNWREIDVATHSFGQGIAVTALQMVQAYSALANEGLMVTPTLIKHADGELIQHQRIFDAKSAKEVNDALEQVVVGEHGTGHNAAIEGFRVMGKTGTAQKSNIGRKGYDPDRVLSSFIGYVDGTAKHIKRKLVMLVIVDEPAVKPRWGGTLAAPVFKASMERILSYLLTMESNELQTAAASRLSGKKIVRNSNVAVRESRFTS